MAVPDMSGQLKSAKSCMGKVVDKASTSEYVMQYCIDCLVYM